MKLILSMNANDNLNSYEFLNVLIDKNDVEKYSKCPKQEKEGSFLCIENKLNDTEYNVLHNTSSYIEIDSFLQKLFESKNTTKKASDKTDTIATIVTTIKNEESDYENYE